MNTSERSLRSDQTNQKLGIGAGSGSRSVHVVFGSECTKSMDWKSVGVFHSFKTSGWKGNITRLMACSPEQRKKYNHRHRKVIDNAITIGPTFVHPNYHYVDGYTDSPTYNKPAALMHFTQEVDIEEEFILYIDSDMLLRKVIDPDDFGSKKGLVVTQHVWYIEEGIMNGLAEQFLDADSAERAKLTHGGYYHLFHKDDAKMVAPRWLHYTQMVRLHPERYFAKLPGSTLKDDIDVVQKGGIYGEAPWISEMYGYAFAAAEVGLDHLFTRGDGGVLYGDDMLSLRTGGPFASHYTLHCHIPSIEHYLPADQRLSEEEQEESFIFNKNHYGKFDILNCNDGFLFPKPPREPKVDEAGASCAENVDRLNYALCDWYRRTCPVESEAYRHSYDICPEDVDENFWSTHDNKLKNLVVPAPCGDNEGEENCKETAIEGLCRTDPAGMNLHCLKTCGFCADSDNIYSDVEGIANVDTNNNCMDREDTETCRKLAAQKECIVNPTYMTANCRRTCGVCPRKNTPTGTTKAITSFFSWDEKQVKKMKLVEFGYLFIVLVAFVSISRLRRTSWVQRKKAM